MSSPMIPNAGDYNSIYGGDPINPNPNPDVSAGYADSVPPPPGSGSQEAQQPPYAAMQAPGNWRDGKRSLRDMVGRFGITGLDSGCKGLLWGLAGAAIACCVGKSTRRLSLATAAKGAAGGAVACWVSRRAMLHGGIQTAAGIGAGYALSKYWR